MEYLNQADGQILNQGQVRKLHPNKSLPRTWDASVCELLGITPILPTPNYQASSRVKTVVRDGVTTDANGNTVMAWTEIDKFEDTTDEEGVVTTKAEHEATYLAKLLQDAKDAKIKAIDAATMDAIVTLAGDEAKQRNRLMLGQILSRKESNGTATAEEITQLNALEAMALEVEGLRITGNAREAEVQAMTTVEEVEAVVI